MSRTAPSDHHVPQFPARPRVFRRRGGTRRHQTTFSASIIGRGCAEELAIIADRFASNTS